MKIFGHAGPLKLVASFNLVCVEYIFQTMMTVYIVL